MPHGFVLPDEYSLFFSLASLSLAFFTLLLPPLTHLICAFSRLSLFWY